MKKIITTKTGLQKTIAVLLLCLGINARGVAQCSPSFTYAASASTISVTSTTTGTTSSTYYHWSLTGAANLNYSSLNASYVFSNLYNGTYTVTLMLDSSTCAGTTSQTLTISGGTNAPACNANFTYTVGTGGQVNFTNTSPADPLNNTTYYWNFGTHSNMYIFDNMQTPSYTYFYNGTYTVTLSISNSITGCSTSSTQTISISNANPAITSCNSAFTYTTGAAGLVNFTSTYAGTAPGIIYNWNYGDGSNNPYGSATASHTYAYNGTYNVWVTVKDTASNCDTSLFTAQTFTITNAATQPCTPTVNFGLYQDSINPQPHVWQINAYYSWQVSNAVWNWGDGTSTTGLSPTHTYSTAAQYTICVMVYSTCGDSATFCQNDSLYRMNGNNSTNGANSIISVTVVNENQTAIAQHANASSLISVYPNPGTGIFKLELNNVSSADAKAQIIVTNILGELVYTSQEELNNNALSKDINLQNASNGTYFIKVIAGGKTFTGKAVITK